MFKLTTRYKKLLADTHTPVSIYLKLRDKFPCSILLESSDYHSNENSFSYVCCKPVASLKIDNNSIFFQYPNKDFVKIGIDNNTDIPCIIDDFLKKFESKPNDLSFINNGLFGYMTYDSVQYFEDIRLRNKCVEKKKIPDIFYNVYQYVIAIDHFKNELYIFEHLYYNEKNSRESLNYIESIINNKNFASYGFETVDDIKINYSDEEYIQIVEQGIKHCKRGDVFQVVLSREYSQQFKGDEFNVYRALRSINPSPYLFYFDYGNFKLFGSSPESQIVIKDNVAGIYPIAGTYRRTGNDKADAVLAEKLKTDPKENAEHIMLVDLARNDLSRNAKNVKVESFSEIQYFSHVIHMVSKVTGDIKKNVTSAKIVADTFPAGTLTGAPKYKAMQLIDKYENAGRGFYGGTIGFMGFNGDFNHAIMIRTFLSKDNNLIYQAGAGIMSESKSENELQEVNNKLEALNKAIISASEI